MARRLIIAGAAVAVMLAAASIPLAAQSLPRKGNTPAHGNAEPAPTAREAGYSPSVNWQLQCAGCHLPKGQGARRNDVPRMHDFVGHFLEVDGGREFLVRVPGAAQSSVSDAQLAALLNWILKGDIAGDSTPDDFEPYTEAEVAAWRAHPLDDTAARRARLLQRMRAKDIPITDGLADRP